MIFAALLGLTALQPADAQPAERAITLREVVQRALQQNPDVLLARLEEEKAKQAVAEAPASKGRTLPSCASSDSNSFSTSRNGRRFGKRGRW
jgi:outer membrane protein TolC